MMNATVAISVVIAVAVFMVLPYFLSSLIKTTDCHRII